MQYYAVIDTNVLVSAVLKWRSVPGSIMDLAFSGVIVPVVNQEILDEYLNVLSRPKFHLTKEIVRDIMDEVTSRAITLDAEHLEIEMPDPKDVVFYEVTMEARKDEDAYLVTGNIKHFPQRPYVVTPRQMLDIIMKDSDEE